MYEAALVVKHSPVSGLGVFANRGFVTGQRILRFSIIAIDDLNQAQIDLLNPNYLFTDRDRKRFIVGAPSCYLNHSCEPNSHSKQVASSIFLFALRPISPGEEILFHYSINGAADWQMECKCCSKLCIKSVPGNFMHLPAKTQARFQHLCDDGNA